MLLNWYSLCLFIGTTWLRFLLGLLDFKSGPLVLETRAVPTVPQRGSRYSNSMDSSVLTIVRSWVQNPSTPSTIFPIIENLVKYLLLYFQKTVPQPLH